jgi:Fe-S cluster biogenesis protein NfuA
MTMQDDFRQRAKSLETLVARFENAPDPSLRGTAKDLVQVLMELHGAGLERILAIVESQGAAGEKIIEDFGLDEVVRSLLLLYGLHPENMQTRIVRALEGTREFLKSHGASAELIAIDDTGSVTVHFHSEASGGCGSNVTAVKSRVEATILDAAPDAAAIFVKDMSLGAGGGAGFVALDQLQSAKPLIAPFASPIPPIASPVPQPGGD